MATIRLTKYSHRFLARIIIEAKTPLAVGSGEKDIITDALVATDVNKLPYIPGTSIAGVLRSMMGENKAKEIFGFQSKNGKECRGSEIIFTEAKILNSNGKVIDGLDTNSILSDPLLKVYKELPVRQHVRINSRGVAEKSGKFDEQVVFAGTRFCFELEMVSDGENYLSFKNVLSQLKNNTFRLGGGTRSGFGEIEVVELKTRELNLQNEKELELYLAKSSKLSENWDGWQDEIIGEEESNSAWTKYLLTLKPEDFFLFGSGYGDQDADMTPVKACKVEWENGLGTLEENLVLIPATSVKGALSHRVAFHWNKLNGLFAEKLKTQDEKDFVVGSNNKAVQNLFGFENQKTGTQQRGNLLFSDIIEKKDIADKVLTHVAIDRFTGGAMDGALFSEKATYGKGNSFEMSILAYNAVLESNAIIKEALEAALKDICMGLLPLGGGVNRGNGIFTGTLKRNNEIIYPKSGGQKS